MLVFGYCDGLPLILYPTSFGDFRQCQDFGLVEACAPFVDRDRVTVYCPPYWRDMLPYCLSTF